MSLSGVLHVSDIDSNLISIASIVDKGFQVEYTKTEYIVSQKNTENVIGKRQGNIYFLTRSQEVAYTGLSQPRNRATKEI